MVAESTHKRERERTAYFDILRVIAMLAVITCHVAATNWQLPDIRVSSWKWFNIYDSISRYGSSIFVMISGALMLNPQKNLSVQRLYKKNIRKIVIVYIFWSLFYALYICWPELTQGAGFRPFIRRAITGHYHMWFLPMIVGLYIITPLLRKITADEFSTKYFLTIGFLFTILFPALLLALNYLDGDGTDYNAVSTLYSNVNFHLTLGYAFYFVLGFFMNKVHIGKKTEYVIYALGIIGFVATASLTKTVSYHLDSATETFYSRTSLNVFGEILSVFTFVKCRLSRWMRGSRFSQVIRLLSKYSFGIYLIHPFFIERLGSWGLNTLCFNAILSVPTITAIVFTLSLITSAILNKIPIVKKYLV